MSDTKASRFPNRLKQKYRLVVLHEDDYQEVWGFSLNRFNIIAFISIMILLMGTILFSLIAYTPAKELIPGYPDGHVRRNIVRNAIMLDSLEHEIYLRDQYLVNLKKIIHGENLDNYVGDKDTGKDYQDIQIEKSVHDSLLRQQIEDQEQYSLLLNEPEIRSKPDFTDIHFFPPLKGIVTNSYNYGENHFGTDIVAPPDEVVTSVLDGTVILATWTVETGYIIQIQHEHNLLSVYKHNSELLKKAGNYTKAGEAIAIVGNSGELTTGPHLHFELWHNGKPLNPEDYIAFK